MVINLSKGHSLVSNWVAELRDVTIQNDRMRFRRNLERIGEVAAFEISKRLPYVQKEVQTPLGTAVCNVLEQQPVLTTILRAGLALHNGLLSYFDKADNAFVSAYRKHSADGSFNIALEYLSCPEIDGRILIISDPMLLRAPPWSRPSSTSKTRGPRAPFMSSPPLPVRWASNT